MAQSTVGDRIREIRELRGEKQPEFAAAMNAAAKRLKVEARYDNTMVSKMEVARRDVGLTDVLVIASLDPERRGRDWLAWGDGLAATGHESRDEDDELPPMRTMPVKRLPEPEAEERPATPVRKIGGKKR